MNNDPLYSTCALYGQHGHTCEGRITREHAIIIAGKKVQKEWAIIPLCAKGHGVDQFQDSNEMVPKSMREWVAFNTVTNRDLLDAVGETTFKDSRAHEPLSRAYPYVQKRKALNVKYGEYYRLFPNAFGMAAIEVARLNSPEVQAAIKREKNFTQKYYPISIADQRIIDIAKAQAKATGHFVGSDNTMIAIMIREYGKTLKDSVEAVTRETNQ